MTSLFREFAWRGMIQASTEGVEEWLTSNLTRTYIGFDPTAASLHVGSLLPIMGLARLQRFGHTPVALVGGGTGLIGDPSGKTEERQLLSKQKVAENLLGIREQLARFLDFGPTCANAAVMLDNADWLASISFMDFLRGVGKHFTLNSMLAKESVKRRLDQEQGISFTEFSYQLLQAYDFFVLHDRYGCTVQMGGSDQYGNITAGIDLIRKLRGSKAFGLCFPLVTSSSGVKFGKTEAGTVWLDAGLTSPYRFYQFWLNTDDRDVATYLKFFTWLSRDEIVALEEQVRTSPDQRAAARRLAVEVTRMVHGETALARAEAASKVLFGGAIESLSAAEVADIFQEAPSAEIDKARLEGDGVPLAELSGSLSFTASRGEARRLVQQGGFYLNNTRCSDPFMKVTLQHAIEGRYLVLRKGARQYLLVRLR